MKVIIKGKTNLTNIAIIKWCEDPKNKNDAILECRNPATMVEIFKDTAVDYMLKHISKRLKIDRIKLKSDPTYNDILCKKLKEKASDNLKVDKRTLIVEVEE